MTPDSDQNEDSTSFQQRLPMRKPMSMVDYWVNTGQLPYTANIINKSFSESGSSLDEEELSTPKQIFNPSYLKQSELPINSSLEKNYNNSGTEKKNEKLIDTSNSSVDTAAYILANNTTTTKIHTAAIIEGSKSQQEKQLEVSNSSKYFSNNFSQVENNTVTRCRSIESQEKQIQIEKEGNYLQSYFTSESDESLFKSKYINDSNKTTPEKISETNCSNSEHTKKNFKHFKRKKLYNSQDSAVEFTPVSDGHTSQILLKPISSNCEHPALLQTPKLIRSYKKRRKKFCRKSSQRSINHDLEVTPKLKDNTNSLTENSYSLKSIICENSKNLLNQTNFSNEPEINNTLTKSCKSFDEKKQKKNSSWSSNIDDLMKNQFNLNPDQVVLKNVTKKPCTQSKLVEDFEKKENLHNHRSNLFNTMQSLNFYNIGSEKPKYCIVFSDEDDDFEDNVNHENNLEDNIHNLQPICKSSFTSANKKKDFIQKMSKIKNTISKSLNEFEKDKPHNKKLSNGLVKNCESKKKHKNKKIKLMQADEKVLPTMIESKSKTLETSIDTDKLKTDHKKISKATVNYNNYSQIEKNKVNSVHLSTKNSSFESSNISLEQTSTQNLKNWRNESIQQMKKIYQHTIVFSSDESE